MAELQLREQVAETMWDAQSCGVLQLSRDRRQASQHEWSNEV